MAKRVTIRDIAKLAGVSACTASYALRNHPKVTEKTAARVKKIAEEQGYQVSTPVSHWMRQLRSQSEELEREIIYFVVTDEVWNRSKVAPMLYEGGRASALEHGYKLDLFCYDHRKMSDNRLSEILRARGVRGLVIGPLLEGQFRLDLNWEYFAAAGFNLFWWKPHIDRVANDFYGAVITAMNRIHEHGYRRIGLAIYKELDDRFQNNLTAAFERKLKLLSGMTSLPSLTIEEKDYANVGPFSDWFRRHRPDCVLAAHCLLPFLDELGLRVPEDVGYVSLDRTSATRETAGLAQDFALMGASAVDIVAARLNRNAYGVPERPMTTLLRSVWKDGPTLASVDVRSEDAVRV